MIFKIEYVRERERNMHLNVIHLAILSIISSISLQQFMTSELFVNRFPRS